MVSQISGQLDGLLGSPFLVLVCLEISISLQLDSYLDPSILSLSYSCWSGTMPCHCILFSGVDL